MQNNLQRCCRTMLQALLCDQFKVIGYPTFPFKSSSILKPKNDNNFAPMLIPNLFMFYLSSFVCLVSLSKFTMK